MTGPYDGGWNEEDVYQMIEGDRLEQLATAVASTDEARDTVRRDRARYGALHRRHPYDVTADRLGDHLNKIGDKITGAERDQLAQVRHILQQLANRES